MTRDTAVCFRTTKKVRAALRRAAAKQRWTISYFLESLLLDHLSEKGLIDRKALNHPVRHHLTLTPRRPKS